MRMGRLRRDEATGQVDPQDIVPDREREVVRAFGNRGDARVHDDRVDPAQPLRHLAECRPYTVHIGYITRECGYLGPLAGQLLTQRLEVDRASREEAEPRAVAGERLGERSADPSAR